MGVSEIDSHGESISPAQTSPGEIETISLCIQRSCKAENQTKREGGGDGKETPQRNTQTSPAMLRTSQGCTWPIAWGIVLKPALTSDPSSHWKMEGIKKLELGRG